MSFITRTRNRLAFRWKNGDLHGDLTPRHDDSALRYVMFCVLTPEVLQELDRRGFDLNTLRFHIDRKKEKDTP